MIRRAVACLALLAAGCPAERGADGTSTPSATASATPGDRALGIVHAECTGLARAGDCKNAATACSKALALFAAAKVPETDKHLVEIRASVASCTPK